MDSIKSARPSKPYAIVVLTVALTTISCAKAPVDHRQHIQQASGSQVAIERLASSFDNSTTIHWLSTFSNGEKWNRYLFVISTGPTRDSGPEQLQLMMTDMDYRCLDKHTISVPGRFCSAFVSNETALPPVIVLKTTRKKYWAPRFLLETRTDQFSLTDDTIKRRGEPKVEDAPDIQYFPPPPAIPDYQEL